MLTQEQNDLLTKVTGDAPMAKFMRQFWVPAVRSERIEADGDPVRVRLFGENYVAFRGTDGKAAVFEEACPHRRASLTVARNEDNALTCLYHGWKFNVDGKVVDVPTEPKEKVARFCEKVPLKSFPVREGGGIVWVFLGEGEPTQFPDFEFNTLPDNHLTVRVAEINCNWLQVFEGTIDSAHVSILHQTWSKRALSSVSKTLFDAAPRYEFESEPYGLKVAAIRKMPDESQYVRISEFVQPWYSFIPHAPEEVHVTAFVVPRDDETCAQYFVFFRYNEPLTHQDIILAERGFGIDPNLSPDNLYEGGPERWKQDREKMKKGHFTGMYGVLVEDYVINESMGKISDRSREFLGSSDGFITKVRRHLLNQVKAIQEGQVPKGLDQEINYHGIRSTNGVIPSDEDWRNTPK